MTIIENPKDQRRGTTGIEWTDETWNPVTGCSHVSEGCRNCYAETLSLRRGWSQKPWTAQNAGVNVKLHPDRLDKPLRWSRPRLVFVNSMSDLFHELIPEAYINKVFAVMALSKQHTFQVLTKRPERMREYMLEIEQHVDDGIRALLTHADVKVPKAMRSDLVVRDKSWQPLYGGRYPLSNVWLGTSIEEDRWTKRSLELQKTKAAVRFLSLEPLLGPLPSLNLSCMMCGGFKVTNLPQYLSDDDEEPFGLHDLVACPACRKLRPDGPATPPSGNGIDWVIVGGESGAGHRPMDAEWVRPIRDLCVKRGIAFHFKQWGGHTPKAGGRELDGRTWDEMPEVV